MKHTITIEFDSLYPLATDEWNSITRDIHAQVSDHPTLHLTNVVMRSVPNQVETKSEQTYGISLS